MKIAKRITSRIVSCYYFLREKLSPSKIKEGKDIPIIINNFNRLSTLLRLTEALTSRGYTNIYILDKPSSKIDFLLISA